MLSRRAFLRDSLGAAASAGLYTWRVEPHWLEIVERPLPIAGLPRVLEGKTLVQLSDLHVGPRVDDDYLFDTFARVRALSPDVVAYTGDFTSWEPAIYRHAETVYRDLPRGRLATVGILGNHDYGPNWSHPEVAERITAMMRTFGVEILRNEVTEVAGLQIAGMDDYWGQHLDLERSLAALDTTRAALVLSHNPDTVDLPGWESYQGWILAGHTHGGQCKPPFLPLPLLPVKNRRYTQGELALAGERNLYISRGVGHLLEVRFNVRPEVTVFTLAQA